jgi:putative MFS transporter
LGRKPTIIGASALAVALGLVYPSVTDPELLIGFMLTVAIYKALRLTTD